MVKRDATLEQVILVILDLAALFLAANLAFDIRYYLPWAEWLPGYVKKGGAPWGALYQALPYMLFGWFVIFEIFQLYQPGLSVREELSRLVRAQATAFVVLFSAAFFYRGFSYSRLAAIFLMPLSFSLTLAFRHLYRLVRRRALRMRLVRENLLLVGGGEELQSIFERLRQPDSFLNPVGVLCREDEPVPPGLSRLGQPEELGRMLTRNLEVDRVLLLAAGLSREELLEAIEACERHRVKWQVIPDIYQLLMDRLQVDQLAGIPVLGPTSTNLVGLNLVFKRFMDLVVASVLLVALSPLMSLVAILVKLSSPGPVLFVQRRVGRGGRLFKMYKFRTMYSDASDKLHRRVMCEVIAGKPAEETDEPVYKLKNDPRVTAVGRWLRRFSLDELPQLINVIKGEMSLVGPRPAIPYEVKMYRPHHRRRLEVLPGITGLWQVSGRNRLSFEEMVKLDIEYIENWSPALDVRILFRTLLAVMVHRGY